MHAGQSSSGPRWGHGPARALSGRKALERGQQQVPGGGPLGASPGRSGGLKVAFTHPPRAGPQELRFVRHMPVSRCPQEGEDKDRLEEGPGGPGPRPLPPWPWVLHKAPLRARLGGRVALRWHLEAPGRPRAGATQQRRCSGRKAPAAAAPTSKACGPVWESGAVRAPARHRHGRQRREASLSLYLGFPISKMGPDLTVLVPPKTHRQTTSLARNLPACRAGPCQPPRPLPEVV